MIYFGHSRMLYNTDEEKKAIEIIREKFPQHRILNPNTLKHQNNCNEEEPGSEMSYFLKLTRLCKFGVFLVYNENKWSPGSYSEANYMLFCGKKVYVLDIDTFEMKRIYEVKNCYTFNEEKIKLVREGKDPAIVYKNG